MSKSKKDSHFWAKSFVQLSTYGHFLLTANNDKYLSFYLSSICEYKILLFACWLINLRLTDNLSLNCESQKVFMRRFLHASICNIKQSPFFAIIGIKIDSIIK